MGLIIELILDEIIGGWLDLMQWIIPKRMCSQVVRTVLKCMVYLFCFELFLSMVIGVLLLFNEDMYIRRVGRYMIFVPLGISAVQIGIGLIARGVSKRRAKKARRNAQEMNRK